MGFNMRWSMCACFLTSICINYSFFGEQVQRTVNQSIALERAGRVDQIPEGWVTPDGTLFIPGKPTVLKVCDSLWQMQWISHACSLMPEN